MLKLKPDFQKNLLETVYPVSFAVLLLLLNSCSFKREKHSVESNDDILVESTAPDAVNEKEPAYILPGLNHGLIQSPINIVTKNVEGASHEILVHYKTAKEKVENLGHTIQVDYDNGSYIEYDKKIYYFRQFHFHTPSEHHFDGITYPLEMHMVHQENMSDTSEHYVVIAVLFKEGERNKFLDEFLDAIPEHEGEIIEVENKFVDVNDLLHAHKIEGCYHYQGSLTTPPFSESVHWAVIKKIFEASPEQIEKLNMLEGNNARHIQALYGRKVEES